MGSLVSKLEGGFCEDASPRSSICGRDALAFVVADTVLARDKDHSRRAEIVQVARIMSCRRLQSHMRDAQPLRGSCKMRTDLFRKPQRSIVKEFPDRNLAPAAVRLAYAGDHVPEPLDDIGIVMSEVD